jgi:hypothetical protein
MMHSVGPPSGLWGPLTQDKKRIKIKSGTKKPPRSWIDAKLNSLTLKVEGGSNETLTNCCSVCG